MSSHFRFGSGGSYRMTSNLLFASAVAILVWIEAVCGIQLAEDIIKPKRDQRQYRGLTLENGIKTVLISEPKAVKAAATLIVRVGHLSNPDNIPGLAHFCEHMLFMGSDKFPEEDYFAKLIPRLGGLYYAATDFETTTFAFDVGAKYLDKALEVFSRFFIAPRFDESAVERETNAVGSEYYDEIRDDDVRLVRIYQVIGNPDHSFRKFPTGSRATLYERTKAMGLDPREEVVKFWEKWYSSNIMTLAIFGKETLDELQGYADKYFSEIENKDIEVPSWESPFVPMALKRWVDVEALQPTNYISFMFPINDTRPLYRSNPQLQIEYLLGRSGPGSLAAWLIQKGWIQNVEVNSVTFAAGFGMMFVDFTLINEGEKHIEEIGQSLFQAIDAIQKEGPQKRLFDEVAKLIELLFENQEQKAAMKLVQEIAGSLFVVPIPEVLLDGNKLYDYKPEEISMLLEDLNPENLIIVRMTDKLDSSQLENKEQYYNTSYTVKPIPESMMSTFRDPGENKYFKIPPPNPYIPDSFDLKPLDLDNGMVPELIKCDEHFHVWYYQDKYNEPTGYLWIKLVSPVANIDPYHGFMTMLLGVMMNNELKEPLAAASEAGLSSLISSDPMGFTISVNGYPEKQAELVKTILKQITTMKFSPTGPKNSSSNEASLLIEKSLNLEPGTDRTMTYFRQLTTENDWSQEQISKAFKDINAETMKRFFKQLLSQLHIDIFGSGNYGRRDILQIAKITKQILIDDTSTVAVDPKTVKMQRRVKLAEGENSLFQRLHPIEFNTAFNNFYDCGVPTRRNSLLVGLMQHIIHPLLFAQLRTTEQLGYVVQADKKLFGESVGIRVILSSNRDPVYLEQRTESFLAEMTDALQNMTEDEFKKQKEALFTKRFQGRNQFATKSSSAFWTQISKRLYYFGKGQPRKPVLKSITLNEFIEMFNTCLSPKSNERKRLRVWVVGTKAISNGYKLESACEGEINCIDSPTQFRNSHALAPHPIPFKSLKEIEANCPRNIRPRPTWMRYG